MVRVFLRIMGQTLFEHITRELAALNSAFPRTHWQGKPISWQLEKIQPPFMAEHLRHTSQGLPVVLLEANDLRIIDHLWVISKREFMGMTAAQTHLTAPGTTHPVSARGLALHRVARHATGCFGLGDSAVNT